MKSLNHGREQPELQTNTCEPFFLAVTFGIREEVGNADFCKTISRQDKVLFEAHLTQPDQVLNLPRSRSSLWV